MQKIYLEQKYATPGTFFTHNLNYFFANIKD